MNESDWKEKLTPEQYHILREAGTEAPFENRFDRHFEEGEYSCAGCNAPLFRSAEKYNSGCGWPAFTMPWNENAITRHQDNSLGTLRIEVRCAKCDGHLGHVFTDGPPPTGNRFCINSAAMNFTSSDELNSTNSWAAATFGSG